MILAEFLAEAEMGTGRSFSRTFSTIALVLVVVGLASGCNSATKIPIDTNVVGLDKQTPFDLYTHCGINEFKVNGKYFQRVGGPLSDGSGNPPVGWGNPYQHGTLSVSGNVAVFRDKAGHVETFKVRTGVTAFLTICS